VLNTAFGLPTHPLIVHATVVIVPAAALLVAVAAVHPRFRTWIGPVPALAALASCVLVPLSTSSGEDLERRVGHSPLVEKHADLAGTLIWYVLPMALVAVLGYALHRVRPHRKGLVVALAVASVVLGGATLVDVALIGHSGAKAAWSGVAASGG
jgi:hypothetical protein